MLVLTRKPNESILVGENIRITVIEVRGDQVKLGIEAPKTVPIFREEIIRPGSETGKEAGKGGAGPHESGA